MSYIDAPYPGVRPFSDSESGRFFRERETDLLFWMVVAYPEVLVYGKSGLGKTSLVQAGLIPSLQRDEHQVLPPARVNPLTTVLAGRTTQNPFVIGILEYWHIALDRDFGGPANQTFSRFFQTIDNVYAEDGESRLRVVILDQLETMFVSHSAHNWRHDFFQQIRQALEEDMLLRVVLVLRADYLAQVDRYAALLPGKLRARLELRGLDRTAAFKAIVEPSRAYGVTWESDAVEALIAELTTDEDELIDPAMLQLACNLLWQKVQTMRVKLISRSLIEESPGVVGILAQTVDRMIEKVAMQTSVAKTDLRSWILKVLVTPAGTRVAVPYEVEHTLGLPNNVIDALVATSLVRPEFRAGTQWIELSHDLIADAIKFAIE